MMITANSLMFVLAVFELTDLLPAAGILLIVISLMTSLRKRKRKSAGQHRLSPREEGQRARDIRGLRGDMEDLMVEVEQLARRMGTQLDAKTIELEMVIQEADQRIAELKRVQEASFRNQQSQQEQLSQENQQGQTSQQGQISSPKPSQSSQAGEEASLSAAIAEAGDGKGADAVADAEVEVDPLARSVYTLADEGMDPPAIAAKLDEHVGKIELILALRAS